MTSALPRLAPGLVVSDAGTPFDEATLADLRARLDRATYAAGDFDESKHPRHGKGGPTGGQFAPKGGSGETDPDTFAENHAVTLAAASDDWGKAREVAAVLPPELRDLLTPSIVQYRDAGGTWTPARAALHERIIEKYLNAYRPPPEVAVLQESGELKPTLFLLAGGAGSGKTTAINTMRAVGNDLGAIVSADDIKMADLPEWSRLQASPYWKAAGSVLHEESSYLAKALLTRALAQRKDIVYDATLKSFSNAQALFARARAAGYEIQIVYVDVDAALAQRRSDARAAATGRWVPHTFLARSHELAPRAFREYNSLVDRWVVIESERAPGEAPHRVAGDGRLHPFFVEDKQTWDQIEQKAGGAIHPPQEHSAGHSPGGPRSSDDPSLRRTSVRSGSSSPSSSSSRGLPRTADLAESRFTVWEEGKHPRGGKGSPEGGQFIPKGGGEVKQEKPRKLKLRDFSPGDRVRFTPDYDPRGLGEHGFLHGRTGVVQRVEKPSRSSFGSLFLELDEPVMVGGKSQRWWRVGALGGITGLENLTRKHVAEGAVDAQRGSQLLDPQLLVAWSNYQEPLPAGPARTMDFAAIQTGLDAVEGKGMTALRAALTTAIETLLDKVTRWTDAGALTPATVREVHLDLGSLAAMREAARTVATEAYTLGEDTGATALPHTYAARRTAGIPPEKALAFFEGKANFYITGLSDTLTARAQGILYNAMKTGQAADTTIGQLRAVFEPYIGQPHAIAPGKTEQLMPYRLETIVRTNATEAFAEGLKDAVEPAVADGYVIGFASSAILDDRTTAVCRYLHSPMIGGVLRKVLRPEGEEMALLTPPRHWSCRTVFVPVTKDEAPVQFLTPAELGRALEMMPPEFGGKQ